MNRRERRASLRDMQATPGGRADAVGHVRLSVVVPAFDEAERIAATIAALRSGLAGIEEAGGVEVIVVDDGSTDDTALAARAAGADAVVVLVPNRGKGAAVRAGVLAATGRTVAFIDADLSYAPSQLTLLLDAVEAGWDMVVGSRRHVDTTTLVRARRLREVTGRLFNLLTHAVLLGVYRDTQCGLKAFRTDVARVLFDHSRIDRFAFDVELFFLAERYRLSLREVPVEVENATASSVKVVRDALRMVRDLFLIRRHARQGAYTLTPEEAAALAR